jgi:hypothetical protein
MDATCIAMLDRAVTICTVPGVGSVPVAAAGEEGRHAVLAALARVRAEGDDLRRGSEVPVDDAPGDLLLSKVPRGPLQR